MHKICLRKFGQHFILSLFTLIVFHGLAFAQPGKPSTVKYLLQENVKSAEGLPIKMVNISKDSAFWLGTDSLKIEGTVATGSACILQKATELPYAKARFEGETLIISLFKFDRQYVHELEIKVENNAFSTRILIHARNGLSLVKVVPTDQVLVLKKSNFNPGDIVSGYVNFRGTIPVDAQTRREWDATKDWINSEYSVRGPFRVRIE